MQKVAIIQGMNLIVGKRIDAIFTFFTLSTLLVEKAGSLLGE